MRIILVLLMMTLISITAVGEDRPQVALAQINVVVPDRSPAARARAFETAFAQQMVQMSGNPQIIMSPRVQAAAKHVKLWVETYGYAEQPGQYPGSPPSLVLKVTFDQSALQKMIDKEKGVASKPPVGNSDVAENLKSFDLVVTHIQDMQDLSGVLNALRGIYGVQQVSTKDVQSDRATIAVSLSGDPSRFENQIANDYRFKSSSTPLVYEWSGREP